MKEIVKYVIFFLFCIHTVCCYQTICQWSYCAGLTIKGQKTCTAAFDDYHNENHTYTFYAKKTNTIGCSGSNERVLCCTAVYKFTECLSKLTDGDIACRRLGRNYMYFGYTYDEECKDVTEQNMCLLTKEVTQFTGCVSGNAQKACSKAFGQGWFKKRHSERGGCTGREAKQLCGTYIQL